MMKLDGRFWITHNGKNLVGRGRIELLVRIADSGSIRQAAKSMGMSYKAAWDAVNAMNETAGILLLERSVGGKGGGKTQLTEAGVQLIEVYHDCERAHRQFLDQLAETANLEQLFKIESSPQT